MRRITSAVLATLALLPVGAFLSSCNKQNNTPLENVLVLDDQISGFSLLTDEASLSSTLSNTAFTIRNSQPGLITNPQALPYSASDYNVRLNIRTVVDSVNVDVITADGQTTRWTSNRQTFSSAQLYRGIQLRVSHRGTDASSYTYRVVFKRYAHDPHTFSWTAGTATGLPSFSTVIGAEEASGRTIIYYTLPNGGQGASAYTSATGAWSPVALSGIPAGERLVSLVTHQGQTYVTTSARKLYRGSAGSFSAVSLPAGSPAPISVLASQGERIYLVAQQSAGSPVFASYAPASATITSHGHRPHADFPLTGGVSYQGESKTYEGASFYLAGGQTASGQVASSLWSTTNGTDWLVVGGQHATATNALHQTIAHSTSGQRLYRFVTTASGLTFSLSRNGGRTWEEARSTALTGLTSSDFAGYPVYAFTSADGMTVYLLRGARTAGEASRLFIGSFGGLTTTTE